jgi:hypothetical protein
MISPKTTMHTFNRKLISTLLITLFVAGGCTTLRSLAGGQDREAHQLVNAAAEDLAAVRKLDNELSGKMARIPALFFTNNTGEVNTLLDEATKLVEKEIDLLVAAAGKLERASKLKIKDTLKQYITLKKGAADKRVEGYREAQKSLNLLRQSVNGDMTAKRKAQAESQKLDTQVRKIFDEAGKLEREAAQLAKDNPDLVENRR